MDPSLIFLYIANLQDQFVQGYVRMPSFSVRGFPDEDASFDRRCIS